MSTITPRPAAVPQRFPVRAAKPAPTKLTTNLDPIRVLRRHMFSLILSFFIGAVIGLGAWFLLDTFMPLYSSQVLFEVRPGIASGDQFATTEAASDDEILRIAETEGVLMVSRPVLAEAMNNPEVKQTRWSKNYLDATGTFAVDRAVDDLFSQMSSTLIRGSNLFDLSWSSREKLDTSIVLNAVARAYLTRRKDIEFSRYDENLRLFRTRQNETARKIDDLDQEIKAYIREKGIMSLQDPNTSPLAVELKELTAKLNGNVATLNVYQTQFNQTSAKLRGTMEPTPEDILAAEQNPILSPSIRAVMDIRTALQSMRDQFPPDHPMILQAESRLRATELERDAKREEVIKKNLEARLKVIQDQIETLHRLNEETEREAEEKAGALKELAASHSYFQTLTTRRGHLEAQLDADLVLSKEVELLKLRSDATRVRLAQPAETPRGKSFPDPKMIIPLGALFVLGMTVGVIFLRELMDQRVKSASDLAVLPHAEVLGSVPELGEDPTDVKEADLVVRKHPQSVTAEGYRQVTMPIRRSIDHSGHQAILMVGGMPGSGTTTASSNVAAVLQATGKRVVVLDANFRRPRLAQAMDVPTDRPGLGDVLCDEARLDDVLLQSSCGVMVLTAGTPANRLFERLGSEQFDHLLAELRGTFDVIIVDSPPAVVAGDAFMLANKLDATVLVVRANREQRGLVARLINQFSDARSELLGVLLNRPRGTSGGYFKKNYEAMAEYAAKPGA